jgi:hypothetical protein
MNPQGGGAGGCIRDNGECDVGTFGFVCWIPGSMACTRINAACSVLSATHVPVPVLVSKTALSFHPQARGDIWYSQTQHT